MAVGTIRSLATVIRVALLSTVSCGWAWAEECSTPLPTDLAAPARSAGEEGAFAGIWGGAKWDGVLCHTLVVESLSADRTAVVVYSHGAYSGWNIRAPAFFRLTGRIEGGTLHLSFPAVNARAEYRVVDGRLHGKYIAPQATAAIVMERRQ